MHQAVLDFLQKTKEERPDWFKRKRVLEIGSFDINGSPRQFFEDCEYIGIDRREGKGVDVVCLAHEYKDRKKFDVVITTEMLEHDKHRDKTIKKAIQLLKRGGVLIATAANVNRQPHYEEIGEDNYYSNLERADIERWAQENKVQILKIEEDTNKEDIRFILEKNLGF